jgi:Fe-S cluster biogenesis protein NfuA
MGILGKNRRSGDEIERRIRDAIAAMRPLLRIESMGVELVRYERTTGLALLRIDGDCPDCNMSGAVLRTGIEAHLRGRVPEIHEVRITEPITGETRG